MEKRTKYPWARAATALVALALVPTATSGCGPGKLGEAVRPKEPSVSGARGGEPAKECTAVPEFAEPLAVDWPSEKRADLEAAVKKGTLVPVAYDCKSIRVVKSCKIRGTYDFMGISLKHEKIQLNNQDEIKANLPVGGVSLGAGLARGATLDISMSMLGIHSTTRHDVTKANLQGGCEGVTHFVQAVTVGAFEVSKGTMGKVEAGVSVGGFGTEGKSSSEKKSLTSDGKLDACKGWKADSASAPADCRSVIRLELMPITDGKGPKSNTDDGALIGKMKGARCGEGMSFIHGKCIVDKDHGKLCNPNDAKGCEAQCKLGNIGSCTALGRIRYFGIGVPKRPEQALEPLETACSADDPDPKACILLADILRRGPRGVRRDETKSRVFARKANFALLTKCNNFQEAEACGLLGSLLGNGRLLSRDAKLAEEFLNKACDGGYARACRDLGVRYTESLDERLRFLKRGCHGGDGKSCYLAAKSTERKLKEEAKVKVGADDDESREREDADEKKAGGKSDGDKADGDKKANDAAKKAAKKKAEEEYKKALAKRESEITRYYSRACEADHAISCAKLAIHHHVGMKGAEKNADATKRLWARWKKLAKARCEGGHLPECRSIVHILKKDRPGLKAEPAMVKWAEAQWLSVKERDCKVNLEGRACIDLYHAYRKGQHGVRRNKWRAKRFYSYWQRMREKECSPSNPSVCIQLSRYMLKGIGHFSSARLRGYLETGCAARRGGAKACWLLAQQYARPSCRPGKNPRWVGGNRSYRVNCSRYDDPIAAQLWSRRACEGGVRRGCVALAELYRKGVGINQDMRQAFSLYKHACLDSGRRDHHACASYEQMIYDGKGTKKDAKGYFKEVRRRCLHRRAADACATYGYLLDRGIGTKRDKKRAERYLKRACRYSRPGGCLVVARQTEKGRWTRRDLKAARKAYRKVCFSSRSTPEEMEEGCVGAGRLFEARGAGKPNPRRARIYYGRACRKFGNGMQACDNEDRIELAERKERERKRKLRALRKGIRKR